MLACGLRVGLAKRLKAWNIVTLTLVTPLLVVVLVVMPIMLMVSLSLVPLVMRCPATSRRNRMCWSVGPQRKVVSLTKGILSHAGVDLSCHPQVSGACALGL